MSRQLDCMSGAQVLAGALAANRPEEFDRLPVSRVEQGGWIRRLWQRWRRAVEHLRLVMAEEQVATVRNQVALTFFTDFENYTNFRPSAHLEKSGSQMLEC